jgi:hypothetical protein
MARDISRFDHSNCRGDEKNNGACPGGACMCARTHIHAAAVVA